MQIGTGFPLAVVFLALPKAYDGRFSGAPDIESPLAWGLSICTTPPSVRAIPAVPIPVSYTHLTLPTTPYV